MSVWKLARITCVGAVILVTGVTGSRAANFDVPSGDLSTALNAYIAQSGVQLLVPNDTIRGFYTKGVKGNISDTEALVRILKGTGFVAKSDSSGTLGIVRDQRSEIPVTSIQLAQAATPSRAAVETVTVTSSKLGGADVQSIPISITALSQEQLTATQTAGGPDLIKQVPNMTFTKTNFSGYSIQLRGIGTQAISVTTDPAVAVAFNDTPFIRNHFFEQEFYDVSQVEVLRGPQGTLYGRNATGGVVNLVSARPTDQFEAMASADIGNYHNRRLEAMINIPIVDDRFDLRVAGEWTKRQGYSLNEQTDSRIDGRDLWSGRVSLGIKPTSKIQAYLIWEHFSEADDRIRSAKQLCKTDYGPGGTATNGTIEIDGVLKFLGPGRGTGTTGDYFAQGCAPASLYSPQSYQAPLGYILPYVLALQNEGNGNAIDPYASQTQSHNLRVIDSGLNPIYKAKNDVVEFNADYAVTPSLTFTSQTGFGHDFLYSAEDYNRFGAAPGLFALNGVDVLPSPTGTTVCTGGGGSGQPCTGPGGNSVPAGAVCPASNFTGCVNAGYFCDPQVGCSDRLMIEDLSQEHAWQLSQEFRLTSNFSGPLNFSAGGNYLHYETEENYYVFSNVFTLINGGFQPGRFDSNTNVPLYAGFQFNDPTARVDVTGGYVDPNPISHLNNNGHNYFLSQNPYVLNSYAAFGEVNYSLFSDLKLTGGLRWTEDQKHFVDIPSWLIEWGWGYPVAGTVNQQWGELTGRAVANWTPKLDFTDQTLIYGSYSHGYKAGGANPPGAIFSSTDFNAVGGFQRVEPTHPLTFKPEFIDAFEMGTKNTLLEGAFTLNGDVFYYNYENYQISQIVDRTAINLNFDAHVKGAELEATWEPVPGLRFNFAGGWEDTAIAKGQSAVDLMDRTAGVADWFIVKPFANEASNCIFPGYVAKWITQGGANGFGGDVISHCAVAYELHNDPLTGLPYIKDPTTSIYTAGLNAIASGEYQGFDPATAPNNGAGFSKNLGGNQLPNAPPYTVSVGVQYTFPVTTDWAATARSDFYWQAASWWRVFNDLSYDRLRGYSSLNLTLILTSQTGWQVMLYDKNVFNTTAITGAFLNSDDSGLTTNVFLTDPKLIGIRVTKNW